MTGSPPSFRAPVLTASVCAAVIIAGQVAAKAARDALFLTNFHISALPTVLVASALLSIGAVLLTARAMSAYGPSRLVPPLFFGSGVLLVGEWLLATHSTRLASVAVYLHIAVIGSIIISGFWSTINERFDPRTAKAAIGKIGGGATAGGLFGRFLAERVGAYAGIVWVLPIIAALHLLTGVLLLGLRTPHSAPAGSGARGGAAMGAAERVRESGVRVLRRVPYLRNLALIVLLGNVAATLLDFVFKARAAQIHTGSAELVRFFAVFYTVVSLVTLAVQAGLTHRLIERIGIANLMAIRPAAMTAGGLLAVPFMSLPGLAILRGLEAVVQGSLYRSGYELLFTPVVPDDKRNTKTIIDVGADRLGDTLGGLIVRAVLFLPAALAGQTLILLAVAISLLGILVARALRAGYVRALEANLLDRANVLNIEPPAAEMHTLMESFTGIDLSMSIQDLKLQELRRAARAPGTTAARETDRDPETEAAAAVAPGTVTTPLTAVAPALQDADLALLTVLRSGNAARVRNQLTQLRPTNPLLAAQVIALLAWDDVTSWAARALGKAAPSITGQLVDRLLDPDESFAIRRRIPRILGTHATPRAVAGLMAGLADSRFEVRFQAASALAHLHERHPSLALDTPAVYAAVVRETKVDKALWNEQRLLDEPAAAADAGGIDAASRSPASRTLEHAFTLLSLVLPRAPLQIAFKGLLTHDAILRGTSLEYLESVMPREVWERLHPFLGEVRQGEPGPRPAAEVLDELLQSQQVIDLKLEELRKPAPDR